MFAIGPPNQLTFNKSYDTKEDQSESDRIHEYILCLDNDLTQNLVVCVTNHNIYIYGGKHNQTIVGVLKHEINIHRNECYVSIAWKYNKSQFAVCFSGKSSMTVIYNVAHTNTNVLDFNLPDWIEDSNCDSKYAPCKLDISFYTYINDTDDQINVLANGNDCFIAGTKNGFIFKVLWTGEIKSKYEISKYAPIKSNLGIKHIDTCFKSIACFVLWDGSAGVLHHSNANVVAYIIRNEGSSCVSIHSSRRLIAIGLLNGDIEIYNFYTQDVIAKQHDNVNQQRKIIKYQLVNTFSLNKFFSFSNKDIGYIYCLKFTKTSIINTCIIAFYSKYGFVMWNVSGCRLMSNRYKHELHSASHSILSAHQLVNVVAFSQDDYKLLLSPSLVNVSKSIHQYTLIKYSSFTNMTTSFNSLHLISDDTLLLLRPIDWNSSTLEWKSIKPPGNYVNSNWPIKHVAVSESALYYALAGENGCIVFNFKVKKWRLFGNVNHEKSVKCIGLFWWKDSVVCILNKEDPGYSLLCYPKHHLDNSSLLFNMELKRRPYAVDCNYEEKLLVINFIDSIDLYHVHLSSDERTLQITKVQSIEHRPSFGSVPLSISILPCGFTRKSNIKYPKCVVLDTNGTLSLLDTESRFSKIIFKAVYKIWIYSWTTQCASWPVELQYTIFLFTSRGLFIWIPSLDIDASSISDLCYEFEYEVTSIGCYYGILVGVTQNITSLTKLNSLPCYEISARLQPVLNEILKWLIVKDKFDLAIKVVGISLNGLPRFLHCLELLLFSALESDYKNKSLILLPKVVQLLQHCPKNIKNMTIIKCARKSEENRMTLLFPLAGEPENIFNECIQLNDLKLATICLVLINMRNPEMLQEYLNVLLHAVSETDDQTLLSEITEYAKKFNP